MPTSRTSVDKCSGERCICKSLNKKMIRNIVPREIVFHPGPSVFPGGGAIQMVIQPSREEIAARVHRERSMYMEAKYGRKA